MARTRTPPSLPRQYWVPLSLHSRPPPGLPANGSGKPAQHSPLLLCSPQAEHSSWHKRSCHQWQLPNKNVSTAKNVSKPLSNYYEIIKSCSQASEPQFSVDLTSPDFRHAFSMWLVRNHLYSKQGCESEPRRSRQNVASLFCKSCAQSNCEAPACPDIALNRNSGCDQLLSTDGWL